MKSLRTVHIPASLDTSRYDLTNDFFTPLLSASSRYDRGVGFFSSGWLRINASGMVIFAANNGRARWITSPILSSEDWQAMLDGNAARRNEVLHQTLARTITNLERDIETRTLSALAWMIADNILDFRLAVPANDLTGEFHAKFGIFADEAGDRVSFEGSYNDSIQGTRNYESLKVFCSWKPYHDEIVQHDVERFEKLWHNEDPNVHIYDLPDAAHQQILLLRTTERPYPKPKHIAEKPAHYVVRQVPRCPTNLRLRDYQQDAIRAWFDHDCRGILEMATGTGKTITALAAAVRLYERERKLAVIISCPYQHLVDQWNTEALAFGLQPVLAYQSKARWLDIVNSQVMEFNAGYRKNIVLIVTHTTFVSADFQRSIGRINQSAMLIADEVHHLGAERSQQSYPEHITYRLALSATPDRWFDDVGTSALRAYFGETVFSFLLEKAIGISLTPYYYYPHLVSLTDDEMDHYETLSVKIARLATSQNDTNNFDEALKILLFKRAQLLNKAENKLAKLAELVDQQPEIVYTLFYCAPDQIDDVLRLLGLEKGLLVHRFTAEENAQERQRLLKRFAERQLHGLVAMKCLDEGVDVPNTRTAFFLASSSNPREFIQRRGRILRKAPGKNFSTVHDLIAIPPTQSSLASATFQAERSIVRRELERFKEFANLAQNKHQALDAIWDLARHYGLMDF